MLHVNTFHRQCHSKVWVDFEGKFLVLLVSFQQDFDDENAFRGGFHKGVSSKIFDFLLYLELDLRCSESLRYCMSFCGGKTHEKEMLLYLNGNVEVQLSILSFLFQALTFLY